MIVQDIISLIQIRTQHISITEDVHTMITFINMAISELYRRFNLSIKSETITTNSDLALYELRNEDVQILLALFEKNGRELVQSDVLGSSCYDYKMVNYKSFLLRTPKDGYLYAVYKASPIPLKDIEDKVLLPDCMMTAMLTYISYLTNDTINRDNKNEAAMFMQLFDKQCQELENQGYKVALNTETLAVQAKGFV